MRHFLLMAACLATRGPALSSDWMQFGYGGIGARRNFPEV
jgi:hypothetical protein